MKNQLFRFLFTFSIIGFLFTGFSFAQQHNDSSQNHKNMQMKGHKMMDQSKMMDSTKKVNKKNPIFHEGVIDLKAIDENKDGKVYQDMMDFNVISDEPGKCPLCGMTLKKVTLKEAKETLLKNGFKVKN